MFNYFLDHNWTMALLIVAIIAFVAIATVKEQQDWDKFAQQHHCQAVRFEKGGTATTVMNNGKVGFTTLPDKVTYRCDDEKEYVRNQ